jgi:hypothetical protein
MSESGSPKIRNYQREVDDLKAHITARGHSLARQLAKASEPRINSDKPSAEKPDLSRRNSHPEAQEPQEIESRRH